MNKCYGCGVEIGEDRQLCERCFRIVHYNEYQQIMKDNTDFIPILNSISKTNDLVILVVDLFNLGNLSNITKYLKNNILLVFTKRDILPKSMYDERLLNYSFGISYIDKLIISSKKNYQFDELLSKIKKYQKSSTVYVIGYTNAGKSTMINQLLHDYSSLKTRITTSPLPSTTLNTIEITLDDTLTLIDTPGLLEERDLLYYVSGEELKKIVPKKEIKPFTYQIKVKQYFIIGDYATVEAENIDLTFYFSNALNIKRVYKKPKEYPFEHAISVRKEDIVIKGLGFIKTKQKGVIKITTLYDIDVFTRYPF